MNYKSYYDLSKNAVIVQLENFDDPNDGDQDCSPVIAISCCISKSNYK